MLQRLRLCRTSDTVFRREIDSRRQWGYGTCYGGIVSPLGRSVLLYIKVCFDHVSLLKTCMVNDARTLSTELFKTNILGHSSFMNVHSIIQNMSPLIWLEPPPVNEKIQNGCHFVFSYADFSDSDHSKRESLRHLILRCLVRQDICLQRRV